MNAGSRPAGSARRDVTHMARGEGWDGILDDGETILWQGRPDATVRFRAIHLVTLAFGLFFSGFAVVWMVMASRAGGYFWMFGLLHFFAGLGVAFGPIYGSAWRRRHTWYTLTDRRAFIATDIPFRGRKLTSWPIGGLSQLDYRDDDLPSVYFAHEMRRSGKRGYLRHDIGFERIADGREVYRLLRDIQMRAHPGATTAEPAASPRAAPGPEAGLGTGRDTGPDSDRSPA